MPGVKQSGLVRAMCGAAVAGVISAGARRAGALNASGARSAWFVGALVVANGGWRAGAALVAFFASSSLLSRLGPRRSLGPHQARGSDRDAVQVWANGGFAALAAIGMAGRASAAWAAAYYGCVAAAAADTWATEIGRGSRRLPRLLLIGPAVSPGTSGGMTARGCAGAAAGAAAIACVAASGSQLSSNAPAGSRFAAVLIAGCLGSLLDSVLGATVQEVRQCPVCHRETERKTHCRTSTTHVRGIAGFDNDGVNFAATATGAITGWWFARR
jgi:uncharacterized protein (TIGR00297 family)